MCIKWHGWHKCRSTGYTIWPTCERVLSRSRRCWFQWDKDFFHDKMQWLDFKVWEEMLMDRMKQVNMKTYQWPHKKMSVTRAIIFDMDAGFHVAMKQRLLTWHSGARVFWLQYCNTWPKNIDTTCGGVEQALLWEKGHDNNHHKTEPEIQLTYYLPGDLWQNVN